MKQNVTVYLVDDHAVVREGYKHLLKKASIEVIAEANNGEEAYHHFNDIKPDVIIMDLSMPGMGGIEAISKITSKNKQAKILAFSMHDDIIFSTRAMQAGAKGYVTKASAPSVLIEAVFAVAANKKYISQDMANKISMQQIDKKDTLSHLTPREFEVLQLLAKGFSLDAIAKTLHLDYKTIANVQTKLRQKLNVESGSQLILAAIKYNIL
ncbi:MAG: DNA-binding response regulator [Methylotenera sp.]|nr:MAG: DNA-binding response regulator [Methylotenera sp.]